MGNHLVNLTILLILTLIIDISIGLAEEQRENKTNVVIKNEVYGTSLRPELVYTIQTPKIIDYDFVLALDSSGSIGDEISQKDAIIKAVPEFLKEIPKNYPDANFNISVVSWDDNIDFAYDANKGFSNSGTSNAKLADLNKSINEISNNFSNKFVSLETEITDTSTPIKASLDILDSEVNRPNDYHKNKRFVIIVTGNGEFKPATDELIRKAQGEYKFYVIGMDLTSSNLEMRKHLTEIAENSKDQYRFLPAGDLYPPLNESLKSALLLHLENATRAPVADNVKIRDTLYCYYKPDKNSAEINGMPIDAASIQISPNGDGTNTIEFEIPGGLLPNSMKRVTLDADFDPGYLPVTVTEDREPITLCSPKSDTPTGRFLFDWFNREHFDLKLNKAERGTGISPFNQLTIQSSELKRSTEGNSSFLGNVVRTLSLSRIMLF